jgi:hypothetical protein
MKTSAIRLFFLFVAVLGACRDEAGRTEAAENANLNELPPTEAARRVANRPAENTVVINQLQGSWQSLDGSGVELVFSPDGRQGMQYEMKTAGAVTEKGQWESPSDCSACGLTNTDICFILLSGDKRTCCNVVRMDRDTLQFFVVGSAGGAKGFARAKE